MTREEILEVIKEVGWDRCCTLLSSETEFASVPLEIEEIESFVRRIEEIVGGKGFSTLR